MRISKFAQDSSQCAMKAFCFVKETLIDVLRVLTSKEGLKNVYGISLYRNALYLILNSTVTAVIGFIFWILAARFYPAQEVGLASAVITTASFLAMLSTLGLDYGLVRYIPHAGKDYSSVVNTCFTIGILTAVAISLIFLAGLGIWSPALTFLRQNTVPFISFVVLVAGWCLALMLQNVFVAQQRAGFALLEGVIHGLVKLALVVPLGAALHATGLFSSWTFSWVLAIVAGLFVLIRQHSVYKPLPTIKISVVNRMAKFSSSNYIATIITGLPVFVIPLLIVYRLGSVQNAYYYAAYATATALFLVSRGTSLSLFAEGSYDEQGLTGYVMRSLKFSFLIIVPLIVVVFLAGDKILLAFGRGYSEDATKLLWLLAVSSIPITINFVYYTKKRVEKQMRSVIGLSTLGTAITLVIAFLLLPLMGIIGAGVGWLVGNGVTTLVIAARVLSKGVVHA
jgi:O-antigen/teichoic acid export membrane protein